MLFPKEHKNAKNSIFKKQNITQKLDGMNIALLRKALK